MAKLKTKEGDSPITQLFCFKEQIDSNPNSPTAGEKRWVRNKQCDDYCNSLLGGGTEYFTLNFNCEGEPQQYMKNFTNFEVISRPLWTTVDLSPNKIVVTCDKNV